MLRGFIFGITQAITWQTENTLISSNTLVVPHWTVCIIDKSANQLKHLYDKEGSIPLVGNYSVTNCYSEDSLPPDMDSFSIVLVIVNKGDTIDWYNELNYITKKIRIFKANGKLSVLTTQMIEKTILMFCQLKKGDPQYSINELQIEELAQFADSAPDGKDEDEETESNYNVIESELSIKEDEDIELYKMGFKPNPFKCLHEAGIKSKKDLLMLTEEQLRAIPKLNKTSLEEILEKIKQITEEVKNAYRLIEDNEKDLDNEEDLDGE